ncbi:MAG: hypothetical protein HY899_14805 [Deltaproteobacteria bacterium]|nr:hypothetical protein [Deltaproteobacteria bacterium]
MKSHREALLALSVLLAGAGAAPGFAPDATAFSETVSECRSTIVKTGTSYTVRLAKLMAKCATARLVGRIPGSTDCNVPAQAAAALNKVPPALSFPNGFDQPGGVCGDVEPADAFYTSCPSPCDAIAVAEWSDVQACMTCITAVHAEKFARGAFAQGDPPSAKDDSRCAAAMLSGATKHLQGVLKTNRLCQARASHANACLIEDDRGRYQLLRNRRALSDRLEKACGGADLAAIGACAAEFSGLACVGYAAEHWGKLLAYDVSRMMAEGDDPAPDETFTQVTAGFYSTCALHADGSPACWGSEFLGRASPPSGTFSEISAGQQHVCAIRGDGSIDCWGWDYYGATSSPTGTFTQLAAGEHHTCALRSDGSLVCWGYGSTWTSPLPGTFAQVTAECALRSDGTLECWKDLGPLPAGTFSQISSADDYACAIRGDGSIACWGNNDSGQSSPPVGTFTEVSAGGISNYFAHACALRSDGAIQCWGSDSYGQSSAPTGTFTRVSAGTSHTCALRGDGAIQCWGEDSYGQSSPPTGTFTQISTWYQLTHDYTPGGCALRSDGLIDCWGFHRYGQAPAPAEPFAQVSRGNDYACALRDDGSIAC